MRSKRKKIVTALVILLVLIGALSYKFNTDSSKFFKIRNSSFIEGGSKFLSQYENFNEFSNPLIKIYFYYYKRNFNKRFVDQNESFNDDTDSKTLKDIISLYRNYWAKDFMKSKNDSTNYNNQFVKKMSTYLIEKGLSKKHKDSVLVFNDIKSDLNKAIKQEGVFCQFFFLDEKFDIIIWSKQHEETYTVKTPYETREIPVVFFSNRILKNRRDFIPFGTQKTGGWPNNEEGVIYSGDYDVNSENFKYSFLTHEGNHFFDVEKYPNLTAADLEYRSKLIELIYVKIDKNRILKGFLSGASNTNRSHGHAYANFEVIKNLSEIIFKKPFEGNYSKWKEIPVELINETAFKLLESNQIVLEANPNIETVFK